MNVWTTADALEAKRREAFVEVERAMRRNVDGRLLAQIVQRFYATEREYETELSRLLK